MKKIKLTEKQFQIIVNNSQQINYFREKLNEFEKSQNDLISVICEFNAIAEFTNIEVDVNAKELLIDK